MPNAQTGIYLSIWGARFEGPPVVIVVPPVLSRAVRYNGTAPPAPRVEQIHPLFSVLPPNAELRACSFGKPLRQQGRPLATLGKHWVALSWKRRRIIACTNPPDYAFTAPGRRVPNEKDNAMKRSVGASLISGLALLWFGPALPAVADIDTDHVMRSTVWVDVSWVTQVEVPYTDNSSQLLQATVAKYCTGFIVGGAGDIATAGHCVQFDESARRAAIQSVIQEHNLAPTTGQFDVSKLTWLVRPEATPTIKIGQPSVVKNAPFHGDEITARLVASQDFDAGDNALVQVAGMETATTVLPVATQAPKVRDKVTAVGFPGNIEAMTDVARQSPTFKEGSISSQTISKKGVPQLQLDGQLISGMSGGPTLNSAGEVVGVNSSSFTGSSESFITDTATLRTFLEQNGVKLVGAATAPASSAPNAAAPAPAVAPTSGSSDTSLTTMLIVVISVLAAVVIAGAVYFVLQRRQSAPATSTASTDLHHDPEHGHLA